MSKPTAPTPPSSGNGGSPAGGSGGAACCPTDFVLTPCRIVKVGGTLQISASELDGFSAGTYEWTSSSAKIRLTNPNSSTVTVEALANPSASREAEVITVTRTAAGCSPVTKTAKVTVAKVTFSAAAGDKNKFGYDNFDTPANTLDDHVCVKRSDRTELHVEIEGGANGGDFDFVCDDPAICLPSVPGPTASFDLTLNAGAHDKAETTLHAKSKCPSAESFTQIQVHVYKEKAFDVVVAKIDKTTAGTNLRWPTTDYAAHGTTANTYLKQAVAKVNVTNYDPANAVTPVDLASGTATVTYDIAAGGGADLAAIGAAMTGTGSKIRVAVIRDMISVYKLSAAASAGDTSLTVTAGSTFYQIGEAVPLGTGATRETITISALAGGTITCGPLLHDHAVGETLEFGAAGWSSDPILVIEGSETVTGPKWSFIHEVGHRGFALRDVTDILVIMYYSRGRTDYGLRYCPRTKRYPAGTTDTENEWETIPRD